MKTRFLTISAILGTVLFSLAFGSCKDEEEDEWGPNGYIASFTWFMDGEEFDFKDVNVDPAQESTYQLVCVYPEDFTKAVIVAYIVDGIYLQPTEDNPQIIEWDWFTIDLDGKEMTVSFKPNDTGKKRVLFINVFASGFPYAQNPSNFTFTQAAQEVTESEEAED